MVLQPMLEVPSIKEKTVTQVRTKKTVKILKYFDDNITVDKVSFGSTPEVVVGGFKFTSVSTQNASRPRLRRTGWLSIRIKPSS